MSTLIPKPPLRLDSSVYEMMQQGPPGWGLETLPSLPAPSSARGLKRELSFDPLRQMIEAQLAEAEMGCEVLGSLQRPHAPARSAKAARPADKASASFTDLKHADHRRLLSRWGKALFRFAGVKRDAFARRSGSYRENFINVLTVCFGTSFEGPGSYWYDNSNAGAFASAMIYCATKGRVSLTEEQSYGLFTKKQPERSASSWMVDEAQLAAWGVTPAEIKALLAGEPRMEDGFPRGAPLIIPPPKELPKPLAAGAKPPVAKPAPAAPAAPSPAPAPAPAPVPTPEPTPAPAGQQPPAPAPLQRQSTVASLAIMMCQSDRFREQMERVSGLPALDRSFSEGARSFMAALASLPQPRELAPLDVPPPAWATTV